MRNEQIKIERDIDYELVPFYKEFVETHIWMDLKKYLKETIELNRDMLEQRMSPDESDDSLRGRSKQARETIFYVEFMASEGTNE